MSGNFKIKMRCEPSCVPVQPQLWNLENQLKEMCRGWYAAKLDWMALLGPKSWELCFTWNRTLQCFTSTVEMQILFLCRSVAHPVGILNAWVHSFTGHHLKIRSKFPVYIQQFCFRDATVNIFSLFLCYATVWSFSKIHSNYVTSCFFERELFLTYLQESILKINF